ncbi:MAG: class 1 fructose-bisphosphatase [Nitrospirae bacterium]|nr:MAG: class 1 fructose-bisphosphatase [Nitrospirota bacterium]
MHAALTLTQFILREEALHPQATGEFSSIMLQIALAGKCIARDLSRSGLLDLIGSTGARNVQGEEVQKLDERANQTFIAAFDSSNVVRTLISEEMEKPLTITTAKQPGKYALFFDPLDGSSNIDVNAPLGSIFSIHRLASSGEPVNESDLLKTGAEQVAAGYLLYGPSVSLVYSCGSGVHQFILDPGIGEFLLAAQHVRVPARGSLYSVNEGNYHKWPSGTRRYLDFLKEPDAASGRPYSSRYSGCLVADVHRILLKGGIFLYPAETKKPEGKLRLMYEAAPLSFLLEQAGGRGSTGREPILRIQPKALHQRVPLIIGSREDVRQAEEFIQTA